MSTAGSRTLWLARLRASAIHLTLSAAIGAAVAALVFSLWYPYPYREISGGRELFLIVVTVDVILGPLITLAVFDIRKPRRQLRLDLLFVAIVQMAALAYGVWTVYLARPVHLVFEIDRFRVVHHVDVLEGAERGLPLTGPTLIAVRRFKDEEEQFRYTMQALGGAELGAQPSLWTTYDAARPDVLKAAQAVAQLRERLPNQVPAIDRAMNELGRSPSNTGYVPMVARKTFWTVLVDMSTAEVVGFLPVDSF